MLCFIPALYLLDKAIFMLYFQASPSSNLYSKITLHLRNKEVSSKRKKSYQTNSILDFSEDLKFKLGGEPLSDYHVRIEIKSSTTLLHKSK